MGRRGLYPTLGGPAASRTVATRMNVLAYADGTKDLLGVAEALGEPIWVLAPVVAELIEHGLIADTNTCPNRRRNTVTANSDVADHYEAVASEYSEQYQRTNLRDSSTYPANYFRLQILTNRLAQAGLNSVYEVGVGEGTPLATIAGMGFRVAGCDIAQSMVALARANFEKRGLDPTCLQWGDIEDSTTFANQLKVGRFDSAIAAGVLPHVRNDRLFLENVGMILRPGGKVFVEFRNKLFSLLTFNRHTKEFILNDLLSAVSAEVRDVVAGELDRRLATDLPPVRLTVGDGNAPGYDAIPSKFHNPFELLELFQSCGYRNARIHWYHYHPGPPMIEATLGAKFREAAMALEHEGTWRGYFLCSAGVVEADYM
jgi:2-polyprenyl-3-methyl-5-hydroxy-6-metoxy-1,4-benzoquinol methylase